MWGKSFFFSRYARKGPVRHIMRQDLARTIRPGLLARIWRSSIFHKMLYCNKLELFGSEAQAVKQQPFREHELGTAPAVI